MDEMKKMSGTEEAMPVATDGWPSQWSYPIAFHYSVILFNSTGALLSLNSLVVEYYLLLYSTHPLLLLFSLLTRHRLQRLISRAITSF